MVGGPGLAESLACLEPGGRLILVGLLGGRDATIRLDEVLRRRGGGVGSVLRARSRAEKAGLVAGFRARFEAVLEARGLGPTVDRVVAADQIGDAVAAMEAGGHFGKIAVAWG
jgi:NADPH:quinone reductase-like Zn-dependent oxidoreductase